MNKGKKRILKAVADMAYFTSKREVDSVCKWLYFQPELPEAVKKIKNVKSS